MPVSVCVYLYTCAHNTSNFLSLEDTKGGQVSPHDWSKTLAVPLNAICLLRWKNCRCSNTKYGLAHRSHQLCNYALEYCACVGTMTHTPLFLISGACEPVLLHIVRKEGEWSEVMCILIVQNEGEPSCSHADSFPREHIMLIHWLLHPRPPTLFNKGATVAIIHVHVLVNGLSLHSHTCGLYS